MAEQPIPKTPEEVFKLFNKGAQDFFQTFAANQGQEMFKVFNQAWATLTTQSLQNPQQWLDMLMQYQQNQMKLWMNLWGMPTGGDKNQPVASPAPGDRRFMSEDWQENPVFDFLKQSYLLSSDFLMQTAENMPLDEDNQKKLRFYTKYFIDAMSPSNFALTNPDVMRQAIETKGQSLVDGLHNLLKDMEKGRISMTDESAFELGKNLAITPGAVIFENELIQLIQYSPSTDTVSDVPLLIVPPSINKFYILDLQPHNSFVKYTVDQGNTVFLISWVNPGVEHKDYGWDDYLELGVFKALDIIKAVTEAKKINTVSWCVGGTILASALAVLKAKKQDDMIASATFFTTMVDFSEPGDLGIFIDETQMKQREMRLEQNGILSGKDLALAFSMLRANDLIWSYVVNNYLKGQTPTPFDILYWNSDSTNLPSNMYRYYIRNMYMENKLIEPDALTMCGVPVNLSNVDVPAYFLSTIDDHIAPWKTTFTTTRLFKGPVKFVLGASGHIAGVINPPAKNKRSYWTDGEFSQDADHWLATAKSNPGSWWPHWDTWLKALGGEMIDPPETLGNATYSEIEPAPGRYVMKRID